MKLLCITLFLVQFSVLASDITCSTSHELLTALNDVKPGDVILLEPGTYTTAVSAIEYPTGDGGTVSRSVYFQGNADGHESNPITLKSKDENDPAILSGEGWDKPGYVLHITGDYWIIDNIKVIEGAKGIILDNSNYTTVKNVEISNIGQEGLHMRDSSSYCIADNLNLHDIGKINDGFGEGVYVGSDNSVWWEGDGVDTGEKGLLYKKGCHNNTIKNSIIGPNITAEPFDIKEGTKNTLIENCTIYGSGVSGNNFGDSHIDVKGTYTTIRCNTFYQENNSNILRAIMVVARQNAGVDQIYTAHHNYIYNNTFHLESDVEVAVAYSGTEENYAWNNIRIPESGNWYSSRIIQTPPNDFQPSECDVVTNNYPKISVSESDIILFPNPGNGVTMIKSTKTGLFSGRVVNALGENMLSFDNTNRIDVSYFQPGIYFVLIDNRVFELIVN